MVEKHSACPTNYVWSLGIQNSLCTTGLGEDGVDHCYLLRSRILFVSIFRNMAGFGHQSPNAYDGMNGKYLYHGNKYPGHCQITKKTARTHVGES